ncbi:endonuclease/exonuclease/phosphatase family protein [Bacillus sp. RO2]|uniref:endonuclease/exonuclease/phosphatase family protein n=1 Tax=Bacillus sp. RO2 TaxID=2723913 RepID=UPI00145EA59C|nr:endonuclease/exonuclease/phosphatase family protein [Bacillus sp. RO2]NMH73549.1 endonuclease/exonuclease/phosphatase family protein [Bacillus sp. RO2]
MKILTWNCTMCFRDKIDHVLPMKADILIIPECESREKWKEKDSEKGISQFMWFGDNPNKGLGVLSMSDSFQINLHPSYNHAFRYIVPLEVSGQENFILLAVWAQLANTKYESYIGQIFHAINYYEELLKKPCFIVGDWNSNKVFDHIKRVGNHTAVVDILQAADIESGYHYFFNEEHGMETKPTHYYWRKQERPFHLDFIFTSRNYLDRLKHFEVGSFEEWIKLSDHMPVLVEFV